MPNPNRLHSTAAKPVAFASFRLVALCTALGCVCIVLSALLGELTSLGADWISVIFLVVYLLGVALIGTLRKTDSNMSEDPDLQALLDEEAALALKNLAAPAFLTNGEGHLLWYNAAMENTDRDRVLALGSNIADLFETDHFSFFHREENADPVVYCGRYYRPEGFVLSERGDGIYLTILHDVTEYLSLKSAYEDDRCAVAYIAIDNVEDVLLYVHEKFQSAVSAVDTKIRAWAESMNGVLKAYDNEKYMMFVDSSYLKGCVESRFEILDEIRNTRIGDGVSITVSIGVSDIAGTLSDRERAARDAIDFALQRGGDQAVYKNDNGLEYYGGRTKSVYKRANIRSRAFTNQLNALIARSDNVLIMGHKYGDFDSIGASVGIARLASICGTKATIAVDMRDPNLAPCIDLLRSTDTYAASFVDNSGALDLVNPDTLLILVDHNNPARAQFPDVASRIANIAVIDHHRKTESSTGDIKLSYIEPSASSTCEMVAEILEVSVSSQGLMKEEADLLLAGILLDTKQFTRNTGTRTFGAAQYLRGAGANPSDVYDLFKTDPDDLSKEARFHTSITVYRNHIALSSCEGKTDESYRVIASKAADKMLTLKDVEASFALVRIGDRIHISGRSAGKINVQLILEKLHGGGHFDVAGAQVEADSVSDVLEQLRDSIDEYLDREKPLST